MIGQVVRVEHVVTANVVGQPDLKWSTVDKFDFHHIRPESTRTTYVFGGGGRWRVVGTLVLGRALHKRSDNSVLFEFGSTHKPLWVAALEAEFYPKGNPW